MKIVSFTYYVSAETLSNWRMMIPSETNSPPGKVSTRDSNTDIYISNLVVMTCFYNPSERSDR